MLGAFFAWTAMSAVQAPFVVALLAAVAASALLGMATERLVLRPLLGQRDLGPHGDHRAGRALQGAARSPGPATTAPARPSSRGPARARPCPDPLAPVLPVLVAISAIALVDPRLPLHAHRRGHAGTAHDQAAAFGMGIDIRRMSSVSWSLAAMTAAVAGNRGQGIIGGDQPAAGGHRAAHLPGGDRWGSSTASAVGWWPGDHRGAREPGGRLVDPLLDGASLKEVVPFVVLVLTLMVRPYGLFGTREVERL